MSILQVWIDLFKDRIYTEIGIVMSIMKLNDSTCPFVFLAYLSCPCPYLRHFLHNTCYAVVAGSLDLLVAGNKKMLMAPVQQTVLWREFTVIFLYGCCNSHGKRSVLRQ